MHEAGVVSEALSEALATGRPARALPARPRALEVVVTDPAHLAAEAIRLHLELVLHDRGLSEVPIEIEVRPIECTSCGTRNRPDPAWAFCDVCGWPLPRQPGRGVRIRARW